MKKRLFFLLAASVLVVSCQRVERQDMDDVVSVSIMPLKYFVDRLSGETLEVNVMVPPGASHATYAPTTGQLQKLSDSRLYVRVGHLGYEEAFAHRMEALNPDMDVLDVTEGVSLIHGDVIDHGDHVHKGGIDPHVWMSPRVMLDQLPLMKEALVSAFPDLEENIAANYKALYDDIREVHEQLSQVTDEMQQRTFLIFHPALTYLARDYNLHQIPIERHGKEPSPGMLRQIIAEAREHNASVIFMQQEFDMRNAELVSAEAGVELIQINPLAYNWKESVTHIIDVFKIHMQ